MGFLLPKNRFMINYNSLHYAPHFPNRYLFLNGMPDT